LQQKGFSKIYSVFSIADYANIHICIVTIYTWRAWGCTSLFFF